MTPINDSSPEGLVLKALMDSGASKILDFAQISKKTGLNRVQVRSACHRLKAAELASYEKGGSVGGGYNGAGYMITSKGEKTLCLLVRPSRRES